jgi:hypothetical protein
MVRRTELFLMAKEFGPLAAAFGAIDFRAANREDGLTTGAGFHGPHYTP